MDHDTSCPELVNSTHLLHGCIQIFKYILRFLVDPRIMEMVSFLLSDIETVIVVILQESDDVGEGRATPIERLKRQQ